MPRRPMSDAYFLRKPRRIGGRGVGAALSGPHATGQIYRKSSTLSPRRRRRGGAGTTFAEPEPTLKAQGPGGCDEAPRLAQIGDGSGVRQRVARARGVVASEVTADT